MHFPPFTPGHRPGCNKPLVNTSSSYASPPQLAAELRVQKLQTLFGILVTVDGFAEAALLREVFHNASELLGDAAVLYRHAIAQLQRGTADVK